MRKRPALSVIAELTSVEAEAAGAPGSATGMMLTRIPETLDPSFAESWPVTVPV
jgi:hypothetical protein